MTDFKKIFEVINKLNREQFDIKIAYKRVNKGAYLDVYGKETETEIKFEFDEEGNLTDIWAIK